MSISDYQNYIAMSRYARYIPEKKRRETWNETCQRYVDFFVEKYPSYPAQQIKEAITNFEVMPSMRSLMTAGKALERDHVAGYNCSFAAVDDPRIFDEIMYILMCGTGVGFSVERQFVSKLPVVADEFHPTDTVINVKDSKIGWATAFRELISLLYGGKIPKWDLSLVRPKGAPLKTFGGRSSGSEPLNDLFEFTVQLFSKAAGRKLNSLEAHDLVCKIADIVVVGGVRRSALISLSNLSDPRMRDAKNGQWWVDDVQRALANNSVAYTEKPDIGIFLDEWKALFESKSGERGLFNRVAAQKKAHETGRRKSDVDFGTNPCGEILLRPNQFCNLSEIVIREDDTLDSLLKKVELATIIGTYQSCLTNFRYLRNVWKKNVEEERLLGVSLTGIMDHKVLNHVNVVASQWLAKMKAKAIEVNKTLSETLGINQSVSITCVKPSGTVSQLVDSSSGIHPRYSEYYVRTVRADKTDPLATFLKSQGVPCEDDVTKPLNTDVFSFVIKSPENARLSKDVTAIEQLEHYKMIRDFWCEHNPSITVYVRDNEWLDVAAWVYKNFDDVCGVSFLPYSDHVYKQAPYQPISKEEYDVLLKQFPQIHWDSFVDSTNDTTTGMKELACSSGVCDII